MKSRVLTIHNFIDRKFDIQKWSDKANYATFDVSYLFGNDQDNLPAYKVDFYWSNTGKEERTTFYVSYEMLDAIRGCMYFFGKKLYRVS